MSTNSNTACMSPRRPLSRHLITSALLAAFAALSLLAAGAPIASESTPVLSPVISSTTPSVNTGAPRHGRPSASQSAGTGLHQQGCTGPNIRCDLQDVAGAVIDTAVPDLPDLPDPGDLIENPLAQVGESIAKAATDAWTATMLSVWDAGLFVLTIVLNFSDSFLTPDLSEGGPARDVYAYTMWIGGALVLVMAMMQLAVAAFRRDGKSLATMLIGTGQFVVVWSAWIGYCVIVVNACGGLTRALMKALLGVQTWSEWDPWKDFEASDVTDSTVATVLGLLGLVLWIAAIGHLVVLLTRAAALIVLAATGGISAAGLVSDSGRSWFWKSLRWFHAAALTPVIMVLILGIGVQLASGVASGLTDTTQQAVGTALPAVVLICISCVAPLALFKLLAFVDPGTPSGASVRAGLAGAGGVQGLLSGSGGSSSGGSGSDVAAQNESSGRSSGESGAEDATSARFTKSTTGALSAVGGIGAAIGAGAGMVATIGAKGASVGADLSNQMGVGHNGYQPDFSGIRNGRGQSGGSGQSPGGTPPGGSSSDEPPPGGEQGANADAAPFGSGGPGLSTSAPDPATVGGGVPGAAEATQGRAGGQGAGGSGGGGVAKPGAAPGGAGGAGGAGGGAAAAGAVPPVPV